MDANDVCFEILKTSAATQAISRAARWLTESPLRTLAVGAGVGAAQGALTHGEEGLGSAALRGGLRGAAIGGTVGGLGRAYRDTRLLDPSLGAGQAVGATAKRLGQTVKNFGKRQIHGFTGAYADQAGEIGLRSTATANKKIELLKRRAADQGPKARAGLAQQIEAAREAGTAGDAALKAGITSIPGVVKGLAKRPLATAKALGRDMIGSGNVAQGAALSVGVPLALAAPDLARGDESGVGGRSMRQKLVGVGSGLVGGALTAGMPILPNIVGGVAVDTLANKAFGAKKPILPTAGQV